MVKIVMCEEAGFIRADVLQDLTVTEAGTWWPAHRNTHPDY